MGRIRHLAIATDDVVGLADFYRNAFGLEEVARNAPGDAATSIFLTDGYLHVAILPATAAGRREGIFHFGFAVDDVGGAVRTAVAAGAKPPRAQPQRDERRPGAEADAYVTDPIGLRVDIARGWAIGQREVVA